MVSWSSLPIKQVNKLPGIGFVDEWQWLNDTVGGDMEFATFITVTAGVFHTPERLNEFKDFFEPKLNTPGLTREIKMDISVIESKVNLINKEQTAVNDAIAQQ